MKASKRNIRNSIAKSQARKAGPPKQSKYDAKRRGQEQEDQNQ
jgi:hypothetical protein